MTDAPVGSPSSPGDATAPAVPRWGLGAAAIGWAGGLLCGSVLLAVWIVVTGRDSAALSSIAIAQVGFWIGLLGAVVVTSRRGGTGDVRRDFGLRFRPVDALVGSACGLGAQLGVVLLYLPFQSFFDSKDLDRPARELADKAHGVTFIVFALVIAIGAPVVEELFYRGLLLGSLRRYMASGPAVLVSAVLFGVTHFELLQLPALALVGVLFAVLTLRAGRLGPAVWAHVAFNATTVVALGVERLQ
jgi:membrane protease YdiL (CAAX protease family)